mmetsp:Transcript_46460/g.70132  ORF Transcript_46460/g.70132 Transcript_46460/m.70132 type:complete len:242 (-) Transcript_46460:2953-3678(-)
MLNLIRIVAMPQKARSGAHRRLGSAPVHWNEHGPLLILALIRSMRSPNSNTSSTSLLFLRHITRVRHLILKGIVPTAAMLNLIRIVAMPQKARSGAHRRLGSAPVHWNEHGPPLNPSPHSIDEVSEQQHFLHQPLVLTPHHPIECAGKDRLLMLLNLVEERLDGLRIGTTVLDAVVGRAEQLSIQTQNGHDEGLTVACLHALVFEAAAGEFAVEDVEGFKKETRLDGGEVEVASSSGFASG